MKTRDRWPIALGIATGAFLLLALRRPDILTNAQFWAEDGAIWYVEFYNNGLLSLLSPTGGYLQTLPRIVLGFSMLLPLESAPLFSNIMGLLFRVLPLAFLASKRSDWASPRARFLFLLYYLLMPGLSEVHANTTNSQWYLGLYCLLIFLAEPSKALCWKIRDSFFIVLTGVSGPFLAILSPCLLLKIASQLDWSKGWPLRTIKALFQPLPVLVGCLSLLQLCVYIFGGFERMHAPLGATVLQVGTILTSRIFVGSLFPELGARLWEQPLLATVLAVPCLGFVAYLFWNGQWRYRFVVLFMIILVVISLSFSSSSPSDIPVLSLLKYSAERYFVLPNMGWIFVLLYFGATHVATHRNLLTAGFVGLIAVCAPTNFFMEPLPSMNFHAHVKEYNEAPSGTQVKIFLLPEGWYMILQKK